MTLFVNIRHKWTSYKTHTPVLIGVCVTIISLLIFGASNMILPSMILIVLTLMLFQKHITKEAYKINKGGIKDEC